MNKNSLIQELWKANLAKQVYAVYKNENSYACAPINGMIPDGFVCIGYIGGKFYLNYTRKYIIDQVDQMEIDSVALLERRKINIVFDFKVTLGSEEYEKAKKICELKDIPIEDYLELVCKEAINNTDV